MLRNIIKKIVNIKLVRFLLISFYHFVVRISYQCLYRISIRNYSLYDKSANNFKIGIASYPHLQQNNGYKGGDSTVNLLLKKIFEEKGYKVEFIEYEPDFLNDDKILKKMIAKLIGMPYVFCEKLNRVGRDYDILIVDSAINFHLVHKNCINLFHYSFGGYRKYAGTDWGTISHMRYIKLNFIQQLGSKKNKNIAVSDFLKIILKENNISVYNVIHNSIDTDVFKPRSNMIREDYLYAGGYSYYGKGFDVLEKIAEKGLKIDCVTNYLNDKSKLTYLPIVPHENMPDIYNKYKLLFYPSRFESFGLVPLEAMACGVPVVISEVGIGSVLKKHIPEFVVSGYNDEAVDNYYSNSEKIMGNYIYYSNKAREFVLNQFSYKTFKRNWLDLIDTIRLDNNEGH